MTRAALLWVRRSSLTVAFPAMVAVVLGEAWSRPGWQYEWDWALSWAASGTVLLGPIVAGLVAHDRARRHAPTLTMVEQTGARGLAGSLALPVAGFVLGSAAWSVAAGVVALRVLRHDPVGAPQLSILVEVGSVLAASAFVGAAIGSWITSRAAGPLAALVVYATFILGPHLRIGGVLEAGGSLDTLVGLRRPAAWLAGFVALHGAIVCASVLAIAVRRMTGPRQRMAVLAGVVPVLLIGIVAFTVGKVGGPYQQVPVRQICVGDVPVVCGPAGSRPVLEIAETGLHEAYGALAGSGLPLRDRYAIERGFPGESFPNDWGVLSLDPSQFDEGEISRADVLATVSTPVLCAAFFDVEPPTDLLEDQQTVRVWVGARISGAAPGAAPEDVLRAYDRLANCAAYRGSR